MTLAFNEYVHVVHDVNPRKLLKYEVDSGDEFNSDDEYESDVKIEYCSSVLHWACIQGDAVVLDLALVLSGLDLTPVDNLGRRPIDLLCSNNIWDVIFNVDPLRLRRLIATDPTLFLQNLARVLDVKPDAAITESAKNNADQFTATLCSLIWSSRHRIVPIGAALVSADEFGRYEPPPGTNPNASLMDVSQ
jgi:hypothetical protein